MTFSCYRGHIIKRGGFKPSKSEARGAFYIYHGDRPDICLGVRLTEAEAEARVDNLLNRAPAHTEDE